MPGGKNVEELGTFDKKVMVTGPDVGMNVKVGSGLQKVIEWGHLHCSADTRVRQQVRRAGFLTKFLSKLYNSASYN